MYKTKQKNVPKRRFKEFQNADAWEQRKLGELGSVAMNKRIFKEQTTESGDVPFYKIGTFGGVADAYISNDLYDEYTKKYPHPKQGDILISASGSIGRTVEYSGRREYFQDSNIVWLQHDDSIKNEFLKYFYEVVKWEGLEGSTIKRLYNKNILDTKILKPDTFEQTKIGAFFSKLDNIITLHQRKCEKLKKIKKAYLSELFPKNGEKFPKRRFAGFTDAWEQRKVSDLGEIFIGLVTTMTSHYTDKGSLLIRNSDIKDGYFKFGEEKIYLDEEFANQNSTRKHKIGDVITVHTGDIGTSAVISEKEADSIGFATIVTRPYKEKITSEYLCAFLNTEAHKNFAMNISTGDGRNNYNLKDYYKCIVPVPTIKEQIRISKFIETLNNLISLHQRKCEKLKKIKKAYLSEMFVSNYSSEGNV